MNDFKDFTALYPVQKTLRFELRPQGRTMEHLKATNFFEEDRSRAAKYKRLKKTIDDFHRKFIDECLSNVSLNWTPLADALEKYQKSKDEDKKASKINLEKEQKRMRGEIASLFRKDKEFFKNLFSEKLFSVILKKEVYEIGDPEEIETLEAFNRFSGYFIGFHENRANIYSEGDEKTAISNRIVNENFPKFFENLKTYQEIRKDSPELIKDAELELKDHDISMDELFSLDGFNKVLKQAGIEKYNLSLGGYAPNTGEKLKGLNELLNLRHQQDKNNKKKSRMVPLYKQILSDRKTFSYLLDAFNEDSQILTSLKGFFEDIEDNAILDRAVNLISSYCEYDTSKLYIRQRDLNQVSKEIFDSWDKLGGMLRTYRGDQLGDKNLERTSKKVDEWLNSKEFTLSDILGAISLSRSEITFDEYVSKLHKVKEEIDAAWTKRNCIMKKISGNEESIEIVKKILDLVQHFLHMFGPFQARPDLSLDNTFYAEFEEIYNRLFAIVPLYNRIRNYLTKSNLNKSKIKLNFKNPTLAAGWDISKEYDNTAVIFRRDGMYYLGIMDPKKKKNINLKGCPCTGPYYQKMEYKLLPGPNKMLPKVFFSKKNKGYYAPSEEITKGYDANKHKKGETFDIDFCHKLIDFFKESIQKNEDWKIFDFKFSPTESYADISGFYQEVERQGYKIQFVDIPADIIDGYVEKGEMFLFQIYNKDFSEKSKGRKNLHTMYWNAAFSDENLRNVVVKLNGEAELFYRDKSDVERNVHEAGTVLVNRTYDVEGKKMPVPDAIHKELYDYHRIGCSGTLSPEAEKYRDSVGTFPAPYDITKDRRYLEDKLFFHVPLTFNFKASGKKNVNEMVVKKFLDDKEMHIIGIDRGERNLIYVSVIDRSGNIIDQKSFNTVDGFDYHEKLDQRETERKDARKSWKDIGKIKDLKEGYLSKIVHEVSKMIIEHNAMVVLEDLNFGFKRGRFKVEKQIYQKFEKMLIDKLNYLVFKNVPDNKVGGILNAYQLTAPFESFAKLGKQSGILFYVPAPYTSEIDPTTGFVDLFNTSGVTNSDGRKGFISKFESIMYSYDDKAFAFSFDYRNFLTSKTDYKNRWTVYSNGARVKYFRERKCYEWTDPTKRIAEALSAAGIEYRGGKNILPEIIKTDDTDLVKTVYYSFLDSLQMRNKDEEKDYIISPVKNRKGEFFKTDPEREDIPKDSDANGAYNIALKGKLLLDMIKKDLEKNLEKMVMPKMEHKTWFEFMQTRGDQ